MARLWIAGIAATLVVWGLALAVPAVPALAAETEVRVYPPPPPAISPIAGAIDFHVHSGPDVFGRAFDDFEVARLAVRNGMRALVLKNHVTSTSDRALIVMRAVPGIEIFGGVALNNAVGGVNAAAVEWMYRMEGGRGKVVWLPTFDADFHLKTFGDPGAGLKVAEGGQLLPETEAVLQVIARETLVLQTGHVGPDEVLAVLRRGRELGLKAMIVTHAMADVPALTLEQMREVAALGGVMELDYLNHLMGPNAHQPWMRFWHQVPIADMAAAITAIGAEHFILATDLGQAGNPSHPDGYKLLVAGLKDAGIAQDRIDLMMKTNPAKLLGLEQ